MKRLSLFRSLAALVALSVFVPFAGARDIKVALVISGSQEKILDIDVFAFDSNFNMLGRGQENHNDTTYVFRDLSPTATYVGYVSNGGLWAPSINDSTDYYVIEVPAEHLPTQLKELVVSARRNSIKDDRTEFIPSRKAKRISRNASTLLQAMALPVINVDQITGEVKTNTGEGVSVFIDYLPASESDKANLRTADVARVEVYDYPQDPRFGTARHVVNFVMVRYVYGGYTSATADQRVIHDKGMYSVGSKLTHDKMTYTVAGGFDYDNRSHTGSDTYTSYLFPGNTIEQEERVEDASSKSRNGFASMRAVYSSDNTLVSNTVGFSKQSAPESFSRNVLKYSPAIYPGGESETMLSSSGISPVWSGNYQFYLPQGWSLFFSPEASYAYRKQDYSYIAPDAEIGNYVREKSWNYTLEASAMKRLGNHSLKVSLYGMGQGNSMDYEGNNPSNIMGRSYYAQAMISGDFHFGNFFVTASVSAFYDYTKFGNLKSTLCRPKYYLMGSYNINDKNRMRFASQWVYVDLPISVKNPNLQMNNPIYGFVGNPEAKAYSFSRQTIDYLWMPSDLFSLSVFGMFGRFDNPTTQIYVPVTDNPGKPLMIRHTVNNGFNNSFNYGLTGTLNLLNNSLVVKGSASFETIAQHGGIGYHGTVPVFNVQASYSWKDFYAMATWRNSRKFVYMDETRKAPQYYNFTLGWGNGDLNISANAICPFSSSYKGIERNIETQNYRLRDYAFSPVYHRTFEFVVSYSFSYGKKVSGSDMPSKLEGVQSGILK